MDAEALPTNAAGRARFRRATIDDAPLLATLAERTFVDTFAAENRPEDMTVYVAQTFGERQQR